MGDDRQSLVGVDDEEQQMTAAEFFAALPWEPRKLDPRTMSAAEFLDAL